MKTLRVTHSFVVRVVRSERGRLLTVQDLRTGEQLEFDSWFALARHFHIETALITLKRP